TDAVGEHAERRVRQAGRDSGGGHRESRERVRGHEPVRHHEREERGQQAVRHVMREVGDAERREKTALLHDNWLTSIPRSTLSMRRVLPTRAASEMTARFAGSRSSASVTGSEIAMYSTFTAGSASTTSRTRLRRS